MKAWIESLLLWSLVALLLFWFVGAHNRLVRLRSAAVQAYGALDALIVRQI
ncbi:MAG: lema family protein, partial [Alphaproteobacteria bacterium]